MGSGDGTSSEFKDSQSHVRVRTLFGKYISACDAGGITLAETAGENESFHFHGANNLTVADGKDSRLISLWSIRHRGYLCVFAGGEVKASLECEARDRQFILRETCLGRCFDESEGPFLMTAHQPFCRFPIHSLTTCCMNRRRKKRVSW